MKLWKVLMRKGTSKSNCKNCNRFDDSNFSINRYSSNPKQSDDYSYDNESNASDFSQRIHEQFEKNIFSQQDLQSLNNYSITNTFDDSPVQIITKITNVMIDCSNGQTLGVTLKGGMGSDQDNGAVPFDKILTISHILENGPVYQNGLVQTGDRLLQVDDYPLHLSESLLESKRILRKKLENSPKFLMLTIEYNVNLLGRSIEHATDSYFVEIEQNEPQFISLGLILSNNFPNDNELVHSVSFYGVGSGGASGGGNQPQSQTTGVFIEYILAASLSDRSGALKVGDRILQVDDVDLLAVRLMPGQVVHLIDQNLQRNGSVTLRVLPRHLVQASDTCTETVKRRTPVPLKQPQSLTANHKSHCFEHSETLAVQLHFDRNFADNYGLRVIQTVQQPYRLLVESIARDSPAYLSGCLQPGDRIVKINSRDVAAVTFDIPAETIQAFFERIVANEINDTKALTIEIEFDIAANIIPASGIFTVRLPCDGIDLGFTLSSQTSTGPVTVTTATATTAATISSSFYISAIRKGSIAYRSGILTIGDRLLAINDSLINQMNFQQLVDMLTTGTSTSRGDNVSVSETSLIGCDSEPESRHGTGFVSLRIQKFEQSSEYEYSVELRNTNGGPLGLTISGSEDRNEPLLLARLTRNGLADRTGQLKIGDRIVSINGESVRDQPLSEAIRLLKQGANGTKPIRIQLLRRNRSEQESLPAQQQQQQQTIPPRTHTASRLFYSDEDDDDNELFASAAAVAADDGVDLETVSTISGAPSSVYGSGSGGYLPYELHCVQLRKDALYDDYGFSVSDGLYRRGVYINRIRKGGPADLSGSLRRFDRIVQVNHVRTKDFDCCLTVPLIAAAGELINLVVLRSPTTTISSSTRTISPAQDPTLESSSTSTLSVAYTTPTVKTATTATRSNTSPLIFNL